MPNRVLINEINSNHEARTPEALARNVVLIQELNSNVSKVRWGVAQAYCSPRSILVYCRVW